MRHRHRVEVRAVRVRSLLLHSLEGVEDAGGRRGRGLVDDRRVWRLLHGLRLF